MERNKEKCNTCCLRLPAFGIYTYTLVSVPAVNYLDIVQYTLLHGCVFYKYMHSRFEFVFLKTFNVILFTVLCLLRRGVLGVFCGSVRTHICVCACVVSILDCLLLFALLHA